MEADKNGLLDAPLMKKLFPFNWDRITDGMVPFSAAGGISGFIYATGTGRPPLMTPFLWATYGALISGSFFTMREWFFGSEYLDRLDTLPTWKQFSARIASLQSRHLVPFLTQ